jgi:CAAD domains of cyanobacterial aminoacyl-tRNA synthetase
MKLDVVLHEIMRIDEYAEVDAETSSADTSTPSTIESVNTLTPAAATIADEDVPISVDPATAEALLKGEELPAESMMDTTVAKPAAAEESQILVAAPTEPTIADEETPICVDAATAKALLKDWELPTESESSSFTAATSAAEPVMNDDDAPTESAELLTSMQTNVSEFFDEAMSSIPAFFNNNQQLLKTLGLILLAVIGLKLTFAGLNAIDDIPLVNPLLKLVGLVYVVRFVWNYLIREQDRQQLAEKFNRTKAEVLGTQN